MAACPESPLRPAIDIAVVLKPLSENVFSVVINMCLYC